MPCLCNRKLEQFNLFIAFQPQIRVNSHLPDESGVAELTLAASLRWYAGHSIEGMRDRRIGSWYAKSKKI